MDQYQLSVLFFQFEERLRYGLGDGDFPELNVRHFAMVGIVKNRVLFKHMEERWVLEYDVKTDEIHA